MNEPAADPNSHGTEWTEGEESWLPKAPPSLLPLGMIAAHHQDLARSLSAYHPVRTAATIAGLLVDPGYQANCLRLETLIHLAMMLGERGCSLRSRSVRAWFAELGEGNVGRMEDPAEDVFVGNVHDMSGNYRVFEGVWETSDFFLQRFLNVLATLPDSPYASDLRASVRALLLLSDAMAERRRLARFTGGEELPRATLDVLSDDRLPRLRAVVRFTPSDLASLLIDRQALAPFIFDLENRSDLYAQTMGDTDLERRPLALVGSDVLVLLPTAISAAVRRHAIEFMADSGFTANFEAALARDYQNLMWNMPLLGGRARVSLPMRRTMGHRIAEAACEIDTKRILHLIVVVDGLDGFADGGLNSLHPRFAQISETIRERVNEFRASAFASQRCVAGLTLVVHCGYGRPFITDLVEELVDWRMECISAADLETLSWTTSFSPIKLWKMLDARDAFAARGIRFVNVNGLLNLFGWWNASGYQFVPANADLDQIPDLLWIPTNSLRDIRIDVRQRSDEHRIADINGNLVLVRRDNVIPLTFDSSNRPLYASYIDLLRGRLKGAYVSSYRPWWIELDRPEDSDDGFAYRIWDALREWIFRAAPILEKSWPGLPRGPLGLLVRCSCLKVPEVVSAISGAELDALLEVRVDGTERVILVELAPDFIRGFASPSNAAERALVRALAAGCAQLAGATTSKADLDIIVGEIVPSEHARHVHLLMGYGYREHMRDRLPAQPLFLEEEDSTAAKFGLAWLVRQVHQDMVISGQAECSQFLHALVDAVWERQRRRLAQLDRLALVRQCLLNIEAIAADQDHWDRTSRALLAVHMSTGEVTSAAAERAFKRHGANLGARLVVEMALCESPLEQGSIPGALDIAPLMTDSVLLHQLGGFADAVANGIVPPEIHLTPYGDVLLQSELARLVMEPLGRRLEGERLRLEAARYDSHFDLPSSAPTVVGSMASEFLSAFATEFGFELDELRRFCDLLEEEGHSRGEAVYLVRRHDLVSRAAAVDGLSGEVADAIIERHSLQPRSSWASTPMGFHNRDWWPWRFRRQLSVLARPLLQVDVGAEVRLLVSPGLFRSAMVHMIASAYEASLDEQYFSSSKMQRWIGCERDRRGHAFNETVKNRLQELGLVARASGNPPARTTVRSLRRRTCSC